ncbi:MAG: hypothetical protein ABI646_00255 [Acidobacteriota bacterium]
MIRSGCFILVWIFLLTFSTIAQVREYSDRGADFLPLKDIRLGVSTIEYVSTRPISVEGQILNAAKYNIVTKDPVPFQDGVAPYNNVVKDLDMHYELLVAPDGRNIIHDTLIDVLKEICHQPMAQRDFSNVGLVGDGNRYLIYSGTVATPNYVWFDGRVVIVQFVRFGERRRDRPATTETLWKEKIRFYPAGQKLVLAKPPKSFAQDFLNRLAAGEFARPKI